MKVVKGILARHSISDRKASYIAKHLNSFHREQTYRLGPLDRLSLPFQNIEVNINKENWISKQQYPQWAEQKHYAEICIKEKENNVFLRPILVKSYALPWSQSCLADKNPLFYYGKKSHSWNGNS